MWVFILILIIYRCADGFEESVPATALCVAVPSKDGDGADGDGADGEGADGAAVCAGERLCVYLFLIYAYIFTFWEKKRKNEYIYIIYILLKTKKILFFIFNKKIVE